MSYARAWWPKRIAHTRSPAPSRLARPKVREAMRSVALRADEHAGLLGSVDSAFVGAVLVALLIPRPRRGIEDGLLVGLVFAGSARAIVPRRPWGDVLSSACSIAMASAGTALGALVLTAGGALGLWPVIGAHGLLVAWAAASVTAAATIAAASWMRRRCRPVRVAVIGSAEAAAELANKVAQRRHARYEVVGYVADGDVGAAAQRETVPMLGAVSELSATITARGLELLVLGPGASRLRFYDELAGNCLTSGIQTVDLDYFYELTFGHVPVRSINSCWFQHLLAMDRAPDRRRLTRAADLVIVMVVGALVLPLLGLLVLLIRRDGGPALFRQLRVGENGRPFTMLKLRTMHVHDGVEARWTAQQDPRITGIGRILRATHFDELPQLVNVLRGEMSIVGPRPEQPAFADRLEALVPHYQRRHLVKPGIAGWAQARCGYAGSEDGSMLKVCHDLYYLRHRSLRFDLAILGETLYAMLLGDRLRGGVGRRLRRAIPQAVPVRQLSSLESAIANECRSRAPLTGAAGHAGSQELLVQALQSADENL